MIGDYYNQSYSFLGQLLTSTIHFAKNAQIAFRNFEHRSFPRSSISSLSPSATSHHAQRNWKFEASSGTLTRGSPKLRLLPNEFGSFFTILRRNDELFLKNSPTNTESWLVAPVWELPPEILSHVFLLCFPVRMDWAEIKRSSLKRSITLAQVNRH